MSYLGNKVLPHHSDKTDILYNIIIKMANFDQSLAVFPLFFISRWVITVNYGKYHQIQVTNNCIFIECQIRFLTRSSEPRKNGKNQQYWTDLYFKMSLSCFRPQKWTSRLSNIEIKISKKKQKRNIFISRKGNA